MAAGLGLRVIGRTTSSVLLHRPVVDPSASDAIPLGCTCTFVVPPGQSSGSLRVRASRIRASRITEIPHYWHGRKRLVYLPVATDDGVAVAASTSSEELISDDGEHPKQELNFGEECQEDPSLVPSSTGSRPITLDEVETPTLNENQRWTIVKTKLAGIMSNAQKQDQGMHKIRHSLGVDLGDSRTGVAISLKGYAPRPLSVLQLKGDKLIEYLLQIASKERADEFIVGLPISFDGKETSQSSKTRSFAGRLAAQAAQRQSGVQPCTAGPTSVMALIDTNFGGAWWGYIGANGNDMYSVFKASTQIDFICADLKPSGMKKRSRKEKLDAYAALVLLHSYFSSKGAHMKLLVPKGLALQERLCLGDDSVIEDDY